MKQVKSTKVTKRSTITKVIAALYLAAALVGTIKAHADAPAIQPYQPTANRYLVNGKETGAGEATLAALQGKVVMKCTQMMLAEGKNGLSFKTKK